MAIEKYTNNAASTLNGGINNSTTSVIVTDASTFPTSGNFRILVDSEIMKVTAVSSNTFTVLRGQEGTTAVSHSNGATVDGILTKLALDAIRADDAAIDTYANEPSAGTAGRLFFPSDGYWVDLDNGSNYVPWGPIYPLVKPPISSWTFRTAGTSPGNSTAQGAIVLHAAPTATGSHYWNQALRTYPGGNFTLIMALIPSLLPQNAVEWGLIIRDSASVGPKFISYGFTANSDSGDTGTYNIRKWDTDTTVNATYASSATCFSSQRVAPYTVGFNPLWYKFNDDGSNRNIFFSSDGQNWAQIHQVARTDFITPNQIGFGFTPFIQSGGPLFDMSLSCISWTGVS